VELVRARLNPRLSIGGVLLTMVDGRTRLSADVADEVRKHFGDRVFNGAVAKCDWMSRTYFHLWKRTAQEFGLGSEELALMLLTHAFSREYLDGMVLSGSLHSLSWMQDSITRNASLDIFNHSGRVFRLHVLTVDDGFKRSLVAF
jgi:hypothetical protein